MNLVKYPEEKILDIRNSIGSNKFNYILHDNFFEILKYIEDNISKNVFKQKILINIRAILIKIR